MRKHLSVVVGLLFALGVSAQTVYESTGAQGKVYSDRPGTGGKAVDLQPLNVIDAPPVPASVRSEPVTAEAANPMPAAPSYRRLAVVFPEASGSVGANYATFEVRVSVEPPLQVENGHAFVFRMDGRNVPGRYTSTEMMVPPEFFGDVAPAGVQQHVVQAYVVDGQGNTIISSAPVSFQTRFVNVLQRPHRPNRPSQRPVATPLESPSSRPGLQNKPVGVAPYPSPANESLRR